MAAPGNFTTLAASGAVTFPLGAQVGYLWQCSNAGTGACGWVPLSSIAASGGALTVSNDTNITASLTGTPSTSLLASTQINFAWSGTLATSRGGTNFNGSGLTLGDILYASSGTAFSRLAGNNSGNTRKFLVSAASSGTATAPIWDFITGADLSGVNMNFTAIGFGMSQPTNAYISTTNRAGIAGANYQISLGGTYTGISTTTSIIDLDITTTHTSTTSTLTTSAGIQITPNTNATSATITSHYAMLINTGTNSGGTVTTAYGIYNNVQTYATTNVGYQQTGTFTKSSDIGMWLANIFTPTSTAVIYEISLNPIFNTTSAVLTSAAGFYGNSRFNVSASNATTIAEQLLNTTFNVSGVGTVTEASVVNINPSINISTASTGTRVTNMYGLKVLPSSVAISTLSTVLGNYCNIYSGTLPTLTGSGKYTTVYGGYFAAPLTTNTDASTGSVALYADSLQVGGTTVSGNPTPGAITATAGLTALTLKCSTAITGLTQTVLTCYAEETIGFTFANSGGSPAQSIAINLIFRRIGSLVMVQADSASYTSSTMTGTISYFYLTTAIPTRYKPQVTGQRWPVTTRENATQYGYLTFNTFATNLTFAVYWYPNGGGFPAGGGTALTIIINPFCYSI